MARERSSLLIVIIILLTYTVYTHLSALPVGLHGASVPAVAQKGAKDVGPRRKTTNKAADMKIGMITMNNRETSYTVMSLANKHKYADKQNYDLVVNFDGPGPWHKLTMIEDAMKTNLYDWIWWTDFDTLITNHTIKIADIIEDALKKHADPDSIDMIFTADCWPMNTGSMIYRSKPEIVDFLDLIKVCGKANPDKSEQDCIGDAVGVHPPERNPVVSEKWKKKFVYVRQRLINAFPPVIGCVDIKDDYWERGDFLIHFAGAWAHLKEEDPTGFLMRKYHGDIVDY